MKRLIFALLIAGVAAACGCPAGSQTVAPAGAAAAVLAASAARDKAFVAGDTATMGGFLADDFLESDEFGKVRDKTAWMNDYFAPIAQLITSGQFSWSTYTRNDVQSRDYGSVVVVVGSLHSKSEVKGVPHTDTPPVLYRFTEVWVKRGAAWKLSVAQKDRPTNNATGRPGPT